jgi:hypothetical protein
MESQGSGLGIIIIAVLSTSTIILVAVSVFVFKVFRNTGSSPVVSNLNEISYPCRYCSTEVPSASASCPSCGAPLSEYVSAEDDEDFSTAFQKGGSGAFSKTIVEREHTGKRKTEKVTVINVRKNPF